jgi:hypothetical protein
VGGEPVACVPPGNVKLALAVPADTVPEVTGEPITVLLWSLTVNVTVPAFTVDVLVTDAFNVTD